ncbi:MAG: hypothetical protein QME81_12640 [bacterium]|nr:hypothetical protein [bacterium]
MSPVLINLFFDKITNLRPGELLVFAGIGIALVAFSITIRLTFNIGVEKIKDPLTKERLIQTVRLARGIWGWGCFFLIATILILFSSIFNESSTIVMYFSTIHIKIYLNYLLLNFSFYCILIGIIIIFSIFLNDFILLRIKDYFIVRHHKLDNSNIE